MMSIKQKPGFFYAFTAVLLASAFVVSATMRLPDAIASIALCMVVWTIVARALTNWRLVIAGLMALFAACAMALSAPGLTVLFGFVALMIAAFHVGESDMKAIN